MNQAEKKCFVTAQIEKLIFIHTMKSSAISKGFTQWVLLKNLNFFVIFILYQVTQAQKMCLVTILMEHQIEVLKTMKTSKIQRVSKFAFFQRGQAMVLVRNVNFFILLNQMKQVKKVFGDQLDRKSVFLDYKSIDLGQSQILHFCKGVIVHIWFWSKI